MDEDSESEQGEEGGVAANRWAVLVDAVDGETVVGTGSEGAIGVGAVDFEVALSWVAGGLLGIHCGRRSGRAKGGSVRCCRWE